MLDAAKLMSRARATAWLTWEMRKDDIMAVVDEAFWWGQG